MSCRGILRPSATIPPGVVLELLELALFLRFRIVEHGRRLPHELQIGTVTAVHPTIPNYLAFEWQNPCQQRSRPIGFQRILIRQPTLCRPQCTPGNPLFHVIS